MKGIRDDTVCGVGFGSAVDRRSRQVDRAIQTGFCTATPSHYFQDGVTERVTTCAVHVIGWQAFGHELISLQHIIDEIEVPDVLERR